jgi:hypothetical protein
MRRLVITVSCLAISLSGLMFSPTHAASSFDGKNGTVDCISDGQVTGSFRVIENVVSEGSECAGIATIPSSVTSIAKEAFYYALNLEEVKFASGSKLKTIGVAAFGGLAKLESIKIPRGVTQIGDNAFENATSLEKIAIPASVKRIGNYSFVGTTKLSKVTFSSGSKLTHIGEGAFAAAINLKEIKIPASVQKIGATTFSRTPKLKAIEVDSKSEFFTSIDGVLFNKKATKLVVYPVGKTSTRYKIPKGVTAIASSAFEGATKLTDIKIPSGVKTIGDGAFFGTSKLTSINFPASVKVIGDYQFYGSTKLRSITVDSKNKNFTSRNGVLFNKKTTKLIIYPEGKTSLSYTIPTSVKVIGDYSFAGSKLRVVKIPKRATHIGDYAFIFSTKLKSINIPSAVKNIDSGAFFGAKSLSTVDFASKSKLKAIGEYAFYDATSLTSIKIPASVTDIEGGAFYNAKSLSTVKFASNSKLKQIGEYAFYKATSLTSIKIPASVKSIEVGAFYGASKMNKVTFLGNAPTVGSDAFLDFESGAKAYVKSTAKGFAATGTPPRWNGLKIQVS